MCYEETEQLINKYSSQYVAGERHSNTTKKKNKDHMKLQERYQILEDIIPTLPFTITKQEKTQVRTLIQKYNTQFKKLHHNASQETIITALIIIIKKSTNPNINNTNINPNTILIINSRILHDYMKNTPIPLTTTDKYNHEILLEEHPILYK